MREKAFTPAPWVGRKTGYLPSDGVHMYWLNANTSIATSVEADVAIAKTAPALLEALEEAETVISGHVYPKPDAPDDHPWSVLQRIRTAIAAAYGERDG